MDNHKIAVLHPPGKDGVYKVTKSGSILWDESTDAWTYHSGAPATEVEGIYRAVPVIFRGVAKISNAVASMPFEILRGETVIDDSTDYENKLEWLPHPRRVFGLISQSLDLTGRCYHRILGNPGGYLKELRYQSPQTITPKYDREGNIELWERAIQSGIERLKPEEILYHWLPDPYKENEPPGAWPVAAALNAAGILKNLDSYIVVYFERGAVRPIIVSVPRGTPQPERERLGNWFTRLMGGIKHGFSWKVFEADAVKFEQIGDGLESLEDTELTKERRMDVATALGVPANILFSEAVNFATAQQDKLNFYEDTIEPRCDFIAEVINEQLLEPRGYRLQFKPETLDIYQVDENERSESFARLVQGGVYVYDAFQILGFELDEEMLERYKEQMEKKIEASDAARERLEQMPASPVVQQGQEQREELPPTLPQNQNTRAALVQWHRRTLKASKSEKPLDEPFTSDDIPQPLYNSIIAQLKAAKSVDDVNTIFDRVFAEMRGAPADLAEALFAAVDALKEYGNS